MNKPKPTREQIRAALLFADNPIQQEAHPTEYDEVVDVLSAAYRATQLPAQIIGRVIGYIIAAALGVLALAGLLAAVKVLVGVVG